MIMKNFIGLTVILFIICLTGIQCGSPAIDKKPENLVFIIIDDLNTTLGCYGHPLVQTPNIDNLAADGIQFNNVYSNYSVCNPSRSSMLTGLRPESIGVMDNRTTIQSVLGDRITLPYLFKLNGYHTIGIGKIFHSWQTDKTEHDDLKAWEEVYHFKTTPLGQTGEGRNLTGGELGWCEWMAANGDDIDQRDGQSTQKAIEFLRSEHDKPFFLAVGLHKPHDPFIAPAKYFELYPTEDCKLPELPAGWTPPNKYSLPAGTKRIFDKFSDKERTEFLRSYLACTSFMDAQVGKIINTLSEEGLLNNTLVVFMGDHGYHLGEHEWWNKVTLYEMGTRAPFIVYTGDETTKGSVSDAMVEFIDIYPTLAGIFELDDVPEYLEGQSFEKVIRNPSLPFKEAVYATMNRGEIKGRSVKTREWRYTEWDKGRAGVELYDQLKDPFEYDNLAADETYLDVIGEMKALFGD